MKIWLRSSRTNLTHCRTAFGTSISYDGVADGFNNLGVKCVQEYPDGNAWNAVQYVPPNKDDYLIMWYGDPSGWWIEKGIGKGCVAYIRSAEMVLKGMDNLNRCDAVFVASPSSKEYFETIVEPPVYVLSGGIKPSLFYPVERNFAATPFVFLHAAAIQWRKGSNIACAAFTKAFPTEQDVKLVLMSQGRTEMFDKLEDEYKDDDRIELRVNLVTDRRKMRDEYYTGAHCLVYPSLYEAWIRTLAEAMATGIPGIVSRVSAMADFFSDHCGWWIEMSDREKDGRKLPDVDDLATKMRYAYENLDECQLRGNHAAIYAQTKLTWEVGINNALPILESVYEAKCL